MVGQGLGPGDMGAGNNWVQATPGYAALFFLSLWPGAPDPCTFGVRERAPLKRDELSN